MNSQELETQLEKIWDIHNNLSDTILTITRTQFLKSLKNPPQNNISPSGFVYIKGCEDSGTVVDEVRSLYGIRSALEDLEDHLEFFQTVQLQQQAERDAAIARIEQSRIILAMRLAEHHGKKYKVVEEALAFLSDVGVPDYVVSGGDLYSQEKSGNSAVKRSTSPISIIVSGLSFVKKYLNLNQSGLLRNAVTFAASMALFLRCIKLLTKTIHQVKIVSTVIEIGLPVPRWRDWQLMVV